MSVLKYRHRRTGNGPHRRATQAPIRTNTAPSEAPSYMLGVRSMMTVSSENYSPHSIRAQKACLLKRRRLREETIFNDATITDEMVIADLNASLK